MGYSKRNFRDRVNLNPWELKCLGMESFKRYVKERVKSTFRRNATKIFLGGKGNGKAQATSRYGGLEG